jgi:hypothetical protein
VIELDGEELTMDVPKLVGTCALVQGTRGAGKSYLVRVIGEGTIPEVQTIFLDPEGDFATLRERFDILIAGKGGDVPCEVRSARVLALRVAELGVSTVVDMSGLLPAQQHEFVASFVDQLNTLPEKMERPRLLVLDEAHLFCPESGKSTSVAKSAVVMLMSQGRKRGLGAVLVTQRLAKLNNDAASECGNIFICRSSPIDLARAQELIGFEAKDRRALQETPDGFFYARGVALSQKKSVVQFQCREAWTTHPEPGTRHRVAPPPPKTAIKKLLAELRDLPPAEAEVEAKTLEEAKKRIRHLEAELAKPREMAVDVKALEREYARGAAEKDAEWREWARDFIAKIWNRIDPQRAMKAAAPVDGERVAKAFVKSVEDAAKKPVKHVRPEPKRPEPKPVDGLVGKANDMLAALAAYGELPKKRLAMIVGISAKSGTFKKYASTGTTLGYWEYGPGTMRITAAGRAAAGPVKKIPTGGRQLLDMWCEHDAIVGKGKDMLIAVHRAGKKGITVAELQHAVGITNSGTFKKYRSVLNTLGVISGRSRIYIAEELLG